MTLKTYKLFYKLNYALWLLSVGIILLMLTGNAPEYLDLPGVALILFTFIMPHLLRLYIRLTHGFSDYVTVTDKMLEEKGAAYKTVMQRFSEGAKLVYQNISFSISERNETAIDIFCSSPVETLTESQIRRDADCAEAAFGLLCKSSEEFYEAVSEKTLRITLMAEKEEEPFPVCSIVNGNIEWAQKTD